MTPLNPMLRLHIWLEMPEGMLLGLGRAELLLKIGETGSLNKAAQQMGMSYRAAWGRLKASEAMLGQPLVDKSEGRKGFVLTDLGRELAQHFKAWQAEVEAYALTCAQKRFPWNIQPFHETGADDAEGLDDLRLES